MKAHGMPWYLDAANTILRAVARLVLGGMWVVEVRRDDQFTSVSKHDKQAVAEREAARLGHLSDGLEFRVRREGETPDCPVGTRLRG